MATADQQFVILIQSIRQVVGRLRIVQSLDDSENFLMGRGESIYSTFLRATGLLKYSEAITSSIPIEQRVADGQNIVDQLLKSKDSATEDRKNNILQFLESLHGQLEKYVRDVGMIQLRRLRKQIGAPSSNPRGDSLKSSVEFTDDLATNIRLVNQELALMDSQRNGIGQLVQKIDVLALFLQNLNRLVADVVSAGTSNPDQVADQPLGQMGGPFVSLIKAQATGYEQALKQMVDQRVGLNAELILAQKRMRLLRTGLELINNESIALLSVLNCLIYMMKEVKFTCKECRFFSTTPLEGQVDLSSLPPDQQAAEQARINEANERARKFRDSLGAKGGFCTYRTANLPTSTERSCNEVWGLIGNDYWRASEDDQQGRIDVISKARDKLDPRKT